VTSPTRTPAPRLLDVARYAAERILAEAVHDERVGVDAVVALDALTDRLGGAGVPDLADVARDAQLTREQLRRALTDLEDLGYLRQLAAHDPSLAGLRPGALQAVA